MPDMKKTGQRGKNNIQTGKSRAAKRNENKNKKIETFAGGVDFGGEGGRAMK